MSIRFRSYLISVALGWGCATAMADTLPIPITPSNVLSSVFTLQVNGAGTAMPIGSRRFGAAFNGATLLLGQEYRLRATPAPNILFSNWTDSAGAVLGTD